MQRLLIFTAMNNSTEDDLLESWLDDSDFESLVELPKNSSTAPPQIRNEKYIVFHLDDKIYGINSKKVAEVSPALPVTPLPGVPEWLSGIANLRGDFVSVIDLRKLWQKDTEPPAKSRFIIFRPGKTDSPIAFVVDKLSEIAEISDKDINFSAADFTDSFPTFFGKVDLRAQSLFLLDADKILSSLSVKDIKAA